MQHPAFSLPPWLVRLAVGLSLASGLAPGAAAAQDPAPADTARRPILVRGDTIMPSDADSLLPVSPRSAFLRSLVLPGWGQSVLGAPGRGGVYFALEAGSLWMLYKTAQKLDEAYEIERIARATGEIRADQKHPLVRERENQREDWFTLAIFWLFFSGADAFVAAHLQDFEVRVNAVPRPGGGTELRATVPVGP